MRIEKGVSNNYNVGSTAKDAAVGANEKVETATVGDRKHLEENTNNVINDDMLEKAIEQANKNLDQYNKVIEISVHEKTHALIYVLKDTLTNEVIKEFPPRKIQDMIAKMWEMAGILVDERR